MARGLFRHPPQPQQRQVVATPTPGQTYLNTVMADIPLGYWRLGEPSGTDAFDSSGHAANGFYEAVSGAPTLGVTGLISDPNTAVTFDVASSQGVTVYALLPNGTSAGTAFEAWVKPAAMSAATPYPVVRSFLAPQDRRLDYLENGASSIWRYFFYDGTTVQEVDSVAHDMATGSTYYVVVSHDYVSELVTFYVNGVILGTAIDVSAFGPATSVGTNAYVTIARGGSEYWNGTLDEVAIYGSPLPASRVAAHYAAGAPPAGGSSLNRTTSDSIATTESVARQVTNNRTTSDSVAVANTVARTVTDLRTTADSLGIADSNARVVTDRRTASDSLGVSESNVRQVTNNRTAADGVTVGDSVARTLTNLRTAADSLTISESVAGIKVVPRTASDSLTIGDSVARAVSNLRTASDGLTIAESVARIVTLLRTASDALTVGNSVARIATNLRTASDSITISEAVVGSVTHGGTTVNVTAADSLTITESVARVLTLLRTTSDAVTVSDSVARTLSLLRTASDSISVGNTVARTVTNLRTAADGLTIAESVARTVTANRTAGDSLTVGNTVSRVATLFRTASDSVTVSESVDAAKTGGGNKAASVADSVTMADAVTRTLTLFRTAADSLSIAQTVDQLTASVATAADSVTISDAATRQLTLFRAVGDSVTISDSVSVTKNGIPLVPAGAGHKGGPFIGRLAERRPREQPKPVRVPMLLAMDLRDSVRIRTSVNAVVEFNDDEEAIALLVLAGAV